MKTCIGARTRRARDRAGGHSAMPAGHPIIRFVNRLQIALAGALVVALAACHKDIDNGDAVRQGVMNYLAKKSGLSSMDVTIASVSFKKDEADAVVHFQAKGSTAPGSGLDIPYVLERKGNEWVVKGRAGAARGANPHGAAGGMGANPHASGTPALPPGHPAVPSGTELPASSQ